MTQRLIRPDNTALTYDSFRPENAGDWPGIIFIHGFRSDRKATKVTHIGDFCRTHNIPFTCFDVFAHGESDGEWADFTIGRAVHDALLVLDALTAGPQIIIGSSMGGWVALRMMEERPERIAGLLGVAPAPDFTKWVEAQSTREERLNEGFTDLLMEEAKNQYVLDEIWTYEGPIHILQGQNDAEVPWQTAETIQNKHKSPEKVVITYIKDGDHRLNRPEDLAILEQCLINLKNTL